MAILESNHNLSLLNNCLILDYIVLEKKRKHTNLNIQTYKK
jgi:hypothetical protein